MEYLHSLIATQNNQSFFNPVLKGNEQTDIHLFKKKNAKTENDNLMVEFALCAKTT